MADEQIALWETSLGKLEAEAAALKAANRWHSGPRTLLQVLRVHEREVKLVACLAWLLEPGGHHRLGDRAVKALFEELDLPFDETAQVRVVCEERRYTAGGEATPADLVIRVGDVCLLIEAKINASQTNDQCARLRQLWAYEQPALVYLTRDGVGRPTGWRSLSWRAVLDRLAPLMKGASAGAQDFIDTLRLLYSEEGPSMSDDKADFYHRNWRQLSEWAVLRDSAVNQVESAIGLAFKTLDENVLKQAEFADQPEVKSVYRTYELWKPSWNRGEISATIALQWQPSRLLTEPDPWPYVGVRITKLAYLPHNPFVKQMVQKLDVHAAQIGWSDHDTANGWPWWRYVPPIGDERELKNLTDACRLALESGWRQLSGPLDELFASD